MDSNQIEKFLSFAKKIFTGNKKEGKVSKFIWYAKQQGDTLTRSELYHARALFEKVGRINQLLEEFQSNYTQIDYDFKLAKLESKKEKLEREKPN
ncbi:hypothetical protein [Chondrinema litorale]|uniref:hypothetical protein n=1 Tax=Chondrinema litorale TaxID=2994555 RepID=UPI002542CA1D|nr:hypothetical protein [Chondrinema litorale]UZS00284.1 hypothetical protein OQ292_40800 [Chondrinema litorale]